MGGRGCAGRTLTRPPPATPATPLTPDQAHQVPPVKFSYDTNTLIDAPQHLPDPAAATAALRAYTTDKPAGAGATPTVNLALRGQADLTPDQVATVTALDQALAASRTDQPITVYRGLTDGRFVLPADWQTRDLTGLTWTDPAFTSTTVNPDGAEAYVGDTDQRGVAIRLHLPTGTTAIGIGYDHGYNDEGEVLLPRGLTFRVTHDQGTQGDYGVRWLDVHADHPTPPRT